MQETGKTHGEAVVVYWLDSVQEAVWSSGRLTKSSSITTHQAHLAPPGFAGATPSRQMLTPSSTATQRISSLGARTKTPMPQNRWTAPGLSPRLPTIPRLITFAASIIRRLLKHCNTMFLYSQSPGVLSNIYVSGPRAELACCRFLHR